MENLKNCINNDLANNYGNLCQRVFSFIKKNCSNKIPKNISDGGADTDLLDDLQNSVPKLVNLMNNQNLNEYLKKVVSFSFDANKYFNDSEPWALKKTDPKKMNLVLFTITQQIKNISILLNPIIPNSTVKVFKTMNIDEKKIKLDNINNFNLFDHDKELQNLEILFKKFENDN